MVNVHETRCLPTSSSTCVGDLPLKHQHSLLQRAKVTVVLHLNTRNGGENQQLEAF